MNVLICDDVASESAKLAALINSSGHETSTVVFCNGYDVLDFIHTGAVIDVCFLDIIMPEMSGVSLANQLRANGFKGSIVFLTNSNEYAAESYRVNAFSYLLKPPRPEEVRDTLCRLEDAKRKGDNHGLLIKVSKVARYLLFYDISHVEVIKHYVYFRLIDGEEVVIYSTLGEIAPQLLCDSRFVQCHRSYIINMSDIASMNDKEIIMRSRKKIPLSKSFPEVKKKFIRWVIGVGKS